MPSFIKLTLIILTVYFVSKYFVRPVLRVLLKRFIQKMVQKNMQNSGGHYQNGHHQSKKEGTITVDYIPNQGNNKHSSRGNDGDYIDYEEVK